MSGSLSLRRHAYGRWEMKAALLRIQEAAERPTDRADLGRLLCFTVVYCRLCSAEHLPDRKLLRMSLELHSKVGRSSQHNR